MEINLFGYNLKLNRELIILVIPVLLIFTGAAGLFLIRGDNAVVFKEEKKEQEQSSIMQTRGVPTQQAAVQDDEIKVYVVGCVNNPGIVTLRKGQVINDAILLAGGPTENADLANINLVYKLKENATLKVLAVRPAETSAPATQQGYSSGEVQQVGESALNYVADAGTGVAIDTGNGSAGTQQKASKINLNTATVDQLDSLPGIGPESARDIIDYREKNGGFKTINDIMKVSGIKDSKFSKIKDLITAD